MSDKFDGLDATEKAGIGATRTLNRCRAELGRRQETLAAAATRPVIAGKSSYRRLGEPRRRATRRCTLPSRDAVIPVTGESNSKKLYGRRHRNCG